MSGFNHREALLQSILKGLL